MRTSAGVAWPSLSTADGQVHGQIIELPVVGAEGVSLAPDQCTLLYYDLDVNDYNGGLKAYDACTQEALDDPVAPIPSDIGGSQYDVYSWAQPLSNDYTIRCVSQYLLYYVDTSGDVVTTFDLAIDDDGFDGCEWYGVSGSDIWVSYGDTLAKFTPGYSEPTDRVIVTTETGHPRVLGLTAIYMPTPSSSKRVIFVHGFAGSASTPGFSTLLGDSTIDDYVEAFHYYQDSPTCDVPLPVIEPLSGMPVDEGSIGTSTCDSEGDVGLNALALDEAISTLYAENGGHKVILVGFSMGAAIIRGFLDYSTGVNGGTGDGVAANMVDSVMFIAGAHDGSWLLLGANAIDALGAPFGLDGAVDHYLLEPLFNDVGFSYDRPATTELSPLSSWYEWANSDDRPLPSNIGYYNAFGSITFHEHHCYLVVAACQDVSLFGIGDGVLLTGTNDPYDTAWEGGAKFSRPDAVEQWEFEYDRNVVVELNHVLSNPIDAMKDFVNDVANAPELHTNLGAHTHDVIVRSCTTNANVRLDDQYLDIIRGKLNLEVYACPTH